MKNLLVGFFMIFTTILFANEKSATENIDVKENLDGSCTITVTVTFTNGTTFTGTGTASTCKAAQALADSDLHQI